MLDEEKDWRETKNQGEWLVAITMKQMENYGGLDQAMIWRSWEVIFLKLNPKSFADNLNKVREQMKIQGDSKFCCLNTCKDEAGIT